MHNTFCNVVGGPGLPNIFPSSFYYEYVYRKQCAPIDKRSS